MGALATPGVQGLEPAWSYCFKGGHLMPNANEERSEGTGAFASQAPLCSGEEVGLSSSKSITHWETVASMPFPP